MTGTEAYVASRDVTLPEPTENGTPSPLRALCSKLHEQVFAFLGKEAETEILSKVQARCRHTVEIINEALKRYPYGWALSTELNTG